MKESKTQEKQFIQKIYDCIKMFFCNSIKPRAIRLYNNSFLFCLVSAVIINVIIEFLGRKSVLKLFGYVFTSFPMFVFSTAIIMISLCIPMFFKRRLCIHYFISCVWLGLGIANSVFLSYRSTPLVAIDFMILRESLAVTSVYLSFIPLVVVPIALGLAIALLVYIFKHVKDEKVNYKASAITALCNVFFVLVFGFVCYLTGAVSREMRLPDVYDKCGYAYCLTYSIIDYGVDEPETYNKEYISNIKEVINSVESTAPEEKPNIVFLQLESFMDTSRIKDIQFSENPHPFFSELKKQYPSGSLEVNALGACTANVEFEVLTGTYIKDYGFDEYPYKTFLNKTAIESIAYDLKELGYSTTAMHNHDGAFYSRNTAYANLGFDCFIPRECMTGLEYTPTGWAKDAVLCDYIIKALENSENEDFIFAVSVQCHSKYPKSLIEGYNYEIGVTGSNDEEYSNMLAYYAQIVREEDAFLQKLIKLLSDYDEKTIVVMYGDHLPTFIKSGEQLVDANGVSAEEGKYLSEYVLWSNYELDAADADLTACSLSSTVLHYAGIHTGNVMKLYQADITESQLKNYRHAITYDTVEGHHYLNDGASPYKTTNLQLGLQPITVIDYEIREDSLYVYGNGFTEDAKVFINGVGYTSAFVNENILRVTEHVKLSNGDKIKAAIVTFDLVVLTESKEYIVSNLQGAVVANKGKISFMKVFKYTSVVVCLALVAFFVVFAIRKRRKKIKRDSLITTIE